MALAVVKFIAGAWLQLAVANGQARPADHPCDLRALGADRIARSAGPRADWTLVERRTWCLVAQGKTATLNSGESISSAFVAHLVTSKPHLQILEEKGLRIEGGMIDGDLDISDAPLPRSVSLERVAITGAVNAQRVSSRGLFSLKGASIAKGLDLSFSNLHQVELPDTRMAEFRMSAATVGRQFVMVRSTVSGKANLFASRFDQSVFLNEVVVGQLEMKQAAVKGDLLLRGASLGKATLAGISIDGSLWLDDNNRAGACRKISWRGTDGALSLRDAKVGVVLANSVGDGSWPPHLDLDGFTYQRLARPDRNDACPGQSADELLSQPSEDFIAWLARAKFSPQPYDHLAQILTRHGYSDTASDVLVEKEGRERQRALERCGFNEIGSCGRWLILSLSAVLIGYGFDLLFRPLIWILGLTLVGFVVFRRAPEGRAFVSAGTGSGFAYSFETLVPLISLRERHKAVDFKGRARYYFYFHRMAGYLLASFAVAGISGLTKQ